METGPGPYPADELGVLRLAAPGLAWPGDCSVVQEAPGWPAIATSVTAVASDANCSVTTVAKVNIYHSCSVSGYF